MRNQRQRPRFAALAALTALTLLFSGISSACTPSTPTPSVFLYAVHVQDKLAGSDVPKATVTIFMGGGAAYVADITDDKGFARIAIDDSYEGQPATLVVEATGYVRFTRDIDLSTANLPEEVPLEPANAPPDEDTVPSSLPEDTQQPTPTTAVPTATPKPVPTTAEPADTPAPVPTTAVPTPPPEPTPTDIPTPTPTPIPEGLAIAIESAGIFAAPDASSQVMGGVSAGEPVSVQGRSAAGQWFYVRDGQGAEGFAYAPRFQWSGDYDSLPIVTPKAGSEPALPEPVAPETTTSYPLLTVDLWELAWTAHCEGGVWSMSVWIQGHGGDGVYTYYWNEERLAGPLAGEGHTFELSTTEGSIVGTGRVISGDGQEKEKGLFIPSPDCAH